MSVLGWLAVAGGIYLGALALYTLAWLVYLHQERFVFLGKVALVSLPVIAALHGLRAAWRWLTRVDWSRLGQAILDWMGWVTANVVIVSGIGLSWIAVAFFTRMSWEEWGATQKQRILTRFERTSDKPLLDLGPTDVVTDIRDAGKEHLAGLVASVQEWKKDNPGSVLGPDDPTLEIVAIPDTVAEMFSGDQEPRR